MTKFSQINTLLITLTLLSACGKSNNSKDSNSIDAFGISERCYQVKTEEADSKGSLERIGPDADFYLIWQGDSNSVVNFYTEKDWNIHFKINKSPLKLDRLADYGEMVVESFDCLKNIEEANVCAHNMNRILSHIKQSRLEDSKRIEDGKESLISEGQKESFECTELFVSTQLESVNNFIKANTPAEESTSKDIKFDFPSPSEKL